MLKFTRKLPDVTFVLCNRECKFLFGGYSNTKEQAETLNGSVNSFCR